MPGLSERRPARGAPRPTGLPPLARQAGGSQVPRGRPPVHRSSSQALPPLQAHPPLMSLSTPYLSLYPPLLSLYLPLLSLYPGLVKHNSTLSLCAQLAVPAISVLRPGLQGTWPLG